MRKFKNLFKGKRILVTGGTGSIGSEIVRQLVKYIPKQIRIFSRDETKQFFLERELSDLQKKTDIFRFLLGDIRDKERLDRAFEKIDIVFHAAALKHVPFCEYNPFEAIKTNIYGAQNVIDLAIRHNVEKVVAISSDKAAYPNTIMGITKLMMERMVISSWNYSGNARTKFAAVRFGNVLNSRGSVIPLWVEQIKKGGPITVTDPKMKRFFMTIPEAVKLVFSAAFMMLGNEIFVLKMKEYGILELAHETIKEYGNGKKIKIKITGRREREKFEEHLFTKEEENLMLDRGEFYIVMPGEEFYNKRKNKYKI